MNVTPVFVNSLDVNFILLHQNRFMAKVLLVDDDVAFCKMLETFLGKKGYAVETALSAEAAFKKLKSTAYDIILSDVRLPQKDGTEILKQAKIESPKTQVILMTGYAEVSLAVDAMKKGAFDYISKPINPSNMLETIQQALATPAESSIPKTTNKPTKSKPKSTANPVAKTLGSPEFVSGVSDASKKLNHYIKLVAPTNMSVLIVGDSGTGKEYAAKQIHDQSKRASAPFVAVDCGAIPKELAASEFFGHLKGSFTGAVNDKTGHFEAANGGTLFLDEIGNLSYDLQVQLLRALQERKIKPVGSNKEIEVDIRVVAATNDNLEKAVEKGSFREDLFHRLNEFSIAMPTLKERTDDLIIFANHFLEKANEELDKEVVGFDDEVLSTFKNYTWPGNLRELQNYIKRAVLFTEGTLITKAVLPDKLLAAPLPNEEEGLYKNQHEKQLIIEALKATGGNKSKAARKLHIDRKTLYNKLKTYQIDL